MSPGRRYAAGMGGIAGLSALAINLAVPAASRSGPWLALGLALLVQGPLGWWLVDAVGSSRLHAVWVGGMLARLALVGVTGLVIVPLAGYSPAGVLIPLVALLLAFVLLEGGVLMVQQSRMGIR